MNENEEKKNTYQMQNSIDDLTICHLANFD